MTFKSHQTSAAQLQRREDGASAMTRGCARKVQMKKCDDDSPERKIAVETAASSREDFEQLSRVKGTQYDRPNTSKTLDHR